MNIIEIFFESSLVVQLVMLSLITMSIISWGIIIWKVKTLSVEKKRLLNAKANELNVKMMDDDTVGTLLSNYTIKTNKFYSISTKTKSGVAGAREQAVNMQDSMIYTYNQNIRRGCSTLATIASSAPYIGLLGTVWGILVSFQGLAEVQVVTLQTVAPGIIEALVATAIGLVTAIPALIGVNAITRLSNSLVGEIVQTKNQILNSLHDTYMGRNGGR
ncbi:putative Tol-Pal system protein TolQ [Vibrio chagasii]|nr:putative Tol-Pal system protein TolQ [Vibrio chagasii]